MIYLVYASQSASIKNRVKKITKEVLKNQIDEMNYVKFDALNTPIYEWLDECISIPLGYDEKVVVVENCNFLKKERGKVKKDVFEGLDLLEKYLLSSDKSSTLIMTVTSLSIDKNNNLFKVIEQIGKVIEIPDMDASSWLSGVRKYCLENNKLNIDDDAINELANRTMMDVALLQNSVNKLALYKDHITLEDVKLMVARPLDDESFLLFNYLIQDKKLEALALYKDLLVNNVEPVVLISMLANQFRLIHQVIFLSKRGFDNELIAKELGIKPNRVFMLKKNSYLINHVDISKILNTLFELDNKIKSGQVDRFYVFELFLINFKCS